MRSIRNETDDEFKNFLLSFKQKKRYGQRKINEVQRYRNVSLALVIAYTVHPRGNNFSYLPLYSVIAIFVYIYIYIYIYFLFKMLYLA